MRTRSKAPEIDYDERFHRARTEMERQGIDYLLVGPSTDLVYLTGYQARQSERLTLLILPREGEAHLVMPNFELPRVTQLAAKLTPAPWTEVESPTRLVASLVPNRTRATTIAIGGQ